MRHASLVVLALLAEQPRHGYELEQVIRRRNIRLWARIGSSTVYKTLQDLLEDGCVVSESAPAKRGAGREVFEITAEGRGRLSELISRGFGSDASLFSDRIVAMVFAVHQEDETAAQGLRRASEGNRRAIEGLRLASATTDDAMAHVILDFYEDVMKAERRAMRSAAKILGVDMGDPAW